MDVETLHHGEVGRGYRPGLAPIQEDRMDSGTIKHPTRSIADQGTRFYGVPWSARGFIPQVSVDTLELKSYLQTQLP